jgi:hypothetical protein
MLDHHQGIAGVAKRSRRGSRASGESTMSGRTSKLRSISTSEGMGEEVGAFPSKSLTPSPVGGDLRELGRCIVDRWQRRDRRRDPRRVALELGFGQDSL